MTAQKLTVKQQRFVDAFDGDIKATAEKVKISYGYARQLMTRTDIKEELRKRNNKGSSKTGRIIATREQRQQFWTKAMNGKIKGLDRLKASELLGRSEADFTDKTVFPGKDGEPQDISLGNLDAAMRLNDLIGKAVKAKKKAGKDG